jgi:hypothetical protein
MSSKELTSTSLRLSQWLIWLWVFVAIQAQDMTKKSIDKVTLLQQFCRPNEPPIHPYNKPLGSICCFEKNNTKLHIMTIADTSLWEESHANNLLIDDFRRQRKLVVNEIYSEIQLLSAYRHLIQDVKKATLISTITAYLQFTIVLQSTHLLTQISNKGNCHEFTMEFLAKVQRHLLLTKQAMPFMGRFILNDGANNGHEIAMFGLPFEASGAYHGRKAIASLLTKHHAMACDGWNYYHHIPATAICRAFPSKAPIINYQGGKAYPESIIPLVKNYYSSLCDNATYEGLPPYPQLASHNQALMSQLLTFILDKTEYNEYTVGLNS